MNKIERLYTSIQNLNEDEIDAVLEFLDKKEKALESEVIKGQERKSRMSQLCEELKNKGVESEVVNHVI